MRAAKISIRRWRRLGRDLRCGGRPRPTIAPRCCARPPIWCASAPRPIARIMTQEQGKILAEAQGGGAGHRRHHRMVRRGGPPRLWPHRCRAARGHAPARGAGAGRRGGGVHALEFSDLDAGAQDRRRARGRLLDHHQGRRRRRPEAASSWCVALSRPACRRACSTWCSGCRRRFPSTCWPPTWCARSLSPARCRSASTWPASPPRA